MTPEQITESVAKLRADSIELLRQFEIKTSLACIITTSKVMNPQNGGTYYNCETTLQAPEVKNVSKESVKK